MIKITNYERKSSRDKGFTYKKEEKEIDYKIRNENEKEEKGE